MPRIIPRLTANLLALSEKAKYIIERPNPRRRKSLFRPLPVSPTFDPSKYSRSILLAEENPLLHKSRFKRHKRQPARVKLCKNASQKADTTDGLRAMSEQERTWWADPYLRMISSPLRRCLLTERHLPSDFLVRLAAMKVVGHPRQSAVVVPDGLEHSQFRARKSGRAFYVLCQRNAVNRLMDKGGWQRFAPHLSMSPVAAHQIGHLLRVRVLQEVELLADALLRPNCRSTAPLLRRLTRTELSSIRASGIIPEVDALAVLVVPPVNKDPHTKLSPHPSLSTLPPMISSEQEKALPPLSVLYLCQETATKEGELPGFATPKVPLYNGLALFPSSTQRAAFHKGLTRILSTQARQKSDGSKASHGFLLTSNAEIASYADVVPLAVALWRLRMYEGQGWEEENKWLPE